MNIDMTGNKRRGSSARQRLSPSSANCTVRDVSNNLAGESITPTRDWGKDLPRTRLLHRWDSPPALQACTIIERSDIDRSDVDTCVRGVRLLIINLAPFLPDSFCFKIKPSRVR